MRVRGCLAEQQSEISRRCCRDESEGKEVKVKRRCRGNDRVKKDEDRNRKFSRRAHPLRVVLQNPASRRVQLLVARRGSGLLVLPAQPLDPLVAAEIRKSGREGSVKRDTNIARLPWRRSPQPGVERVEGGDIFRVIFC